MEDCSQVLEEVVSEKGSMEKSQQVSVKCSTNAE
jgi:hypothetical protein